MQYKDSNAEAIVELSSILGIRLFVIVVTILLIPVGLVCWLFTGCTRNNVPKKWFAWRPVRILHENNEKWVWFKTIWRRESWQEYGEYGHRYVTYTLIEENTNG